MQTLAVITKAANNVSDGMAISCCGKTLPKPPAIACAAPVMMKLILKPTPVSVTTPITIPTVAAAAPTANAYLAPVSKASTNTLGSMRPRMLRPRINRIVSTTLAPKTPSLTISSRLVKAIKTSAICSTNIKPQFLGLLPLTAVVSPIMAHDVMPTKAAK